MNTEIRIAQTCVGTLEYSLWYYIGAVTWCLLTFVLQEAVYFKAVSPGYSGEIRKSTGSQSLLWINGKVSSSPDEQMWTEALPYKLSWTRQPKLIMLPLNSEDVSTGQGVGREMATCSCVTTWGVSQTERKPAGGLSVNMRFYLGKKVKARCPAA